jgi:hypothetical protein
VVAVASEAEAAVAVEVVVSVVDLVAAGYGCLLVLGCLESSA